MQKRQHSRAIAYLEHSIPQEEIDSRWDKPQRLSDQKHHGGASGLPGMG